MNRAPGAADLVALLLALVGILSMLAAGSYLLAGALKGVMEAWPRAAAIAVVLSAAYLTLAFDFRLRRPWVVRGTRWMLPCLFVVAWIEPGRRAAFDLGALTLFGLALVANLIALLWLHWSREGRRLGRRSEARFEA